MDSRTVTPTSLSRRHEAGAESARGLLLTVLGEFVLPSGGSAWTSSLIDALGRLGVEEKATRQALMRTAASGWLASQRAGRRTRWTLTGQARTLLTEGTERIYGFTGVAAQWDGRWLLVLARVPETDRRARHVLRTRLTWAGFGSPAPATWLSAHTDRAGEAQRILADAGVRDAHVFVAEHRGGELAAMVRQAWDLDTIEAQYERFLADFAGPSVGDPLARLAELVHAWRRFPAIDPALPAALLPSGWSGIAAAGLFERRHAQWAPGAMAAWRALESGPRARVSPAVPGAVAPSSAPVGSAG
jgi:phenylacetic acid degradation operon negative regulatory protein